MALWRKRRNPESYLIQERTVQQKCVPIHRSEEILDLVTRPSKCLEDTAREWVLLIETDTKVLSRTL